MAQKRWDLEVEQDGRRYQGTCTIDGSVVTVHYKGRRKVTQIGGSPPESIAMILLNELVRESATVH